jgi:hypothetical protein
LYSYYQFNQSSGSVIDVIRSYDLSLQSGATYSASGAAVGSGVAVTQTVNTTGLTSFAAAGLDINFGTSPNGAVVVSNLSSIAPNGTVATANTTTTNYWAINNYGTNAALNAQLKFKPTTGWLQNTNANNYTLYKRNSTSVGAWDAPITASAVNVPSNEVTFAGVNSFSQFLISSVTVVLPLELISFSAKTNQTRNVFLEWKTANEQNIKTFFVEKSIDNQHFTTISNLDSKGQNGETQTYFSEDKNLSEGVYYYRLRIEENDGRTEYSKIISINIKGNSSISIYPNPSNGIFNIESTKDLEQIEVFNALGQRIYFNTQMDKSQAKIDLSNFGKGVYFFHLLNEGKTTVQQVIVN